MNHFCELWTKKKSDNELVLILHDNETFTKSKTIISIPDVNSKADYSQWYYAGSNDNIVALTRHETIKKETIIHVVLFCTFQRIKTLMCTMTSYDKCLY
jgi:DTW domain-containing protein YfiP